ncbi:hypothetical protein IQ37_15375 [Chryseobacterium piperi]|uniref:Tetratricopeptide repeat protein n=1 Tax=Chryseobacterium piperi TaxID=558152 RepID=A0A086AWL7_9FLAO|nr:hypothetical protein [Chryseobacterium piperi]ASW73445.1 hypothetical protein CJF12_03495 [Chryseobacterium piperi]KFF21081.1 hypothetical protein IQ37_15375 [Chryseobacterium piperi]
MIKLLTITFLAACVSISAQTVIPLKFDKNIPDSENNWVALPKSDKEKTYHVGFIYFDEYAGYTYRNAGILTDENNQLNYTEDEDSKKRLLIARMGNLEYKVAEISPDLLKRFNLPAQPDWLKNYLSSGSENDKVLNRASKMNGANFPQLALPKLEKLYQNNFKTNKVYFELAFSYNALKDFANAEKICMEAMRNKISDDLINKEYIYSLLQQKKTSEADTFLSGALGNFINKDNKAESMMNMVAFNAQYKNIDLAEKWLNLLKKENDEKYKQNIEQLENIINKNKD